MGCWFREISSGLPLQQAYLPSRSLAPGPKDGVLLVNSNARPQSGFVALRGRMVVWIKELIRWTKVVPCWKSRLDPKKSRGKRPKLIYHLFLHFFPMVLHGLTIEIAIFFIIFLDKPVYLWKPLECCIRNLLGVLNRPNYNFPTKSLLDPVHISFHVLKTLRMSADWASWARPFGVSCTDSAPICSKQHSWADFWWPWMTLGW